MGVVPQYDKEKGKPSWVLLEDHHIATIRIPRFVVVPPQELSEPEQEDLARAMIFVAAQENGYTDNPKKWFDDADLYFDRVVQIHGHHVAVTTPEYLGRRCLFSTGEIGLLLHNPNAAVLV